MTYRGGCKCGAVAFEADGELQKVMACNCSICQPKGYLHWFVPKDQFRLTTPDADGTFQFGKKVMDHRFCSTCGVATHVYGPTMVAVNARVLADVDPWGLTVEHYDGASK